MIHTIHDKLKIFYSKLVKTFGSHSVVSFVFSSAVHPARAECDGECGGQGGHPGVHRGVLPHILHRLEHRRYG